MEKRKVAPALPNKPRRRGLFGQVDTADEACHERELCAPEEREQLKNITTMLQYIGGSEPSRRCAEFAHDKPRWWVYLTVNVARDAAHIRKMSLDNCPDPGEEYLHGPDRRNISCGFEDGRLGPCLSDGAVQL
ncbi:predicted protein [Arabidopsis lyrata subsp. lyrata]|uniref:Predicted protein n=1 Tax=Arabidopsis lyrata subsp. lyrata TaxID=81972 RepID=D7KAX9_ARALL|nr:predicted protein [Arabidopsis lyrata subsp. lyrata]